MSSYHDDHDDYDDKRISNYHQDVNFDKTLPTSNQMSSYHDHDYDYDYDEEDYYF